MSWAFVRNYHSVLLKRALKRKCQDPEDHLCGQPESPAVFGCTCRCRVVSSISCSCAVQGSQKQQAIILFMARILPALNFNTIAQAFLSHSHFMALKSFLLAFFSPLTLFHGHLKTRLACSFRWHMYRARFVVGVSYWGWPAGPSGPSSAACGPTSIAPSFVPSALLASCSVSAPGRGLPHRASGPPVRVPAAGPSEAVICCDVEC